MQHREACLSKSSLLKLLMSQKRVSAISRCLLFKCEHTPAFRWCCVHNLDAKLCSVRVIRTCFPTPMHINTYTFTNKHTCTHMLSRYSTVTFIGIKTCSARAPHTHTHTRTLSITPHQWPLESAIPRRAPQEYPCPFSRSTRWFSVRKQTQLIKGVKKRWNFSSVSFKWTFPFAYCW